MQPDLDFFCSENESNSSIIDQGYLTTSINSFNSQGDSSQSFGNIYDNSKSDESNFSLSPSANTYPLQFESSSPELKIANILISLLKKALKNTERATNGVEITEIQDLIFLSKHYENKQISPSSQLSFLSNQQEILTNNSKKFQCKFCNQGFAQPCQLGGHISKNHPNLSKQYQKRIKKYEDNRLEKIRTQYIYKHLSGNSIRKMKTF